MIPVSTPSGEARAKRPDLIIICVGIVAGVPADCVKGLDAGADDCLAKLPLSYRELIARIRALLRRRSAPAQVQLKIEDLVLDRIARTVQRGQHRIDLTQKEFELLAFLMERPFQPVPRELITEKAWELETAKLFTNLVAVCISTIYERKLTQDLIALLSERFVVSGIRSAKGEFPPKFKRRDFHMSRIEALQQPPPSPKSSAPIIPRTPVQSRGTTQGFLWRTLGNFPKRGAVPTRRAEKRICIARRRSNGFSGYETRYEPRIIKDRVGTVLSISAYAVMLTLVAAEELEEALLPYAQTRLRLSGEQYRPAGQRSDFQIGEPVPAG